MPADFNDDQKVNVIDRTLIEIALGKPYNQRYDLNADGAVNVTDKTTVLLYISKTGGLPCSQTFTYDAVGRLRTATDELGHITTYTYDAQNKVLTQKDNLNNTTAYTYDAKGNLTTVTDANRQQVGSTSEAGISNGCGTTTGTGNGVNDDPTDDNVIDDGCPNTIYNYDNADRLTSVGRCTRSRYKLCVRQKRQLGVRHRR